MHKRRALSVFLVLFLTFFLLAESMYLYHAYKSMQIQDAYDHAGCYHIHVKKPDKGEEQKLLADNRVKRAGACRECPFSDMEGAAAATKNSEVIFRYMDEDALSMAVPKLRCGRLPKKEGEAVVSAALKTDGKYTYDIVGRGADATVRITFGKEEKTFQAVGVLDDFDAGGDSACNILAYADEIKSPDAYYIEMEKAERKQIHSCLTDAGYDYGNEVYDTAYLEKAGGIYTGEYKVELNNKVLDALEGSGDGSVPVQTLLFAAVAFILLTGGLMLCSTVSIGMEGRIQDNALLRMMGASPGMLVLYNAIQVSFLSACAVLAGIPAAVFLAGKTMEYARNLRFSELSHISMEVDVRGMAASAAMVFLLALSCTILPVVQYLKKSVSLMLKGESGREDYGSRKRGRTKKAPSSFLGFRIGCRQALRRPGRTLSVILSMWAVLSLLLVYIVCLNVMRDKMEDSRIRTSEFSYFGDGQVDVAAQMEKTPYVSWYEATRLEFAEFDSGSIRINDKGEGDDFYWMEIEEEGGTSAKIMVAGISREFYQKFFRPVQGGMMPDYETLVSERAGVVADRFLSVSGEEAYALDMDFPSRIKRHGGEAAGEMKLLARVERTDALLEAGSTNPYIFVPQEIFLEDFEPSYTIIYFNVDDAHLYDFQEWAVEHESETLPLGDYANEYMQAKDTKSMLQGILFAALAMVGGITLANLINVFCANARMQKKDYAILSALGMDVLPMHMLVAGEAVMYVVGAVCLTGVFVLVGVRRLLALLLQIELQLNAYLFFLLAMAGVAAFSLCFLLGSICNGKNRRQPAAAVLRDDSE